MHSVSKEIIVNVENAETRAAVLENGKLVEIQIERPNNQRYVGNIYKGRVENVLPGMQAAFVNIGLERNAFLYVEDAVSVRNGKDADLEDLPPLRGRSIEDVVRENQEIIVQITKEPIGTKGARVVTQVTLPGRYVVLMPTVEWVGVSRRIESEEERARLKRIAQAVRPRGMGLIIRTVAEGRDEKDLAQEVGFLVKLWRKIQARARRLRAPVLLHQDYDLIYRFIRDLFTEDVDHFVIDDVDEYNKAIELLNLISPHLIDRVELFKKREEVFDYYGIEEEIEKALRRKVWLDCGGYLIFDQTEALTSIDVNTGRFIGSTNLADTVLKTNLDAAAEIAHQLRLRNIGGIIVIDFIDMESESDRQKVIQRLEDELKKDKTKATVLGFTHLGLVEMTRKKTKQGLIDLLQRSCPYCDGRGRILSEETLALKVEREIKRIGRETDAEAMLIAVHPSVASLVIGIGGSNLARIEEETGKSIFVKGSLDLHTEEIDVIALGTRGEIERKALPVSAGDVIDVEVEEPHATNANDGIARIEGYIIDIDGGGKMVGKRIRVEITKVFRTYARARLCATEPATPSASQASQAPQASPAS